MGADNNKFSITLTLFSLLFLALYVSPTDQTLNEDDDVPEIKKADIKLARIEEQLAKARTEIRNAVVKKSFASSEKKGSYIPERAAVYNNPFAFFQSHNEMIKTFKIWTYKEGDVPLMHTGPMKSIYSIEGDFIEEMERKDNPLVANHPDEAHAFFIPAPRVSFGNPTLFKNFIRVICNANISEGFIPRRDVSMTEINAPHDNIPKTSSGQSPYKRSIFAFFAGGNHGVVRQKLFQHWGDNSDNDIQVYNYLPKDKNYPKLLSQSKYCLCPSGYEVASSRATEAIYTGCIPVIIKDHYVLPYSDVLDWSQFSVQVPVDKIPELKSILQGIPFSKYLEMQKRVLEVQRHFMVNLPAKHFDVLHMILHSVWLRRLNVQLTGFNLN